MTYLFNTPDQAQEMLKTIGVSSVGELFRQVPEKLRLGRPLDLPAPKTEIELEAHVRQLAGSQRRHFPARICLLGGGVYDHFIPAAVDEIVSARRVLHGLHALSGRGQPGQPAGVFRIPDR